MNDRISIVRKKGRALRRRPQAFLRPFARPRDKFTVYYSNHSIKALLIRKSSETYWQ